MIPQYYTLKLKLPTYGSKESSIPQYRKPRLTVQAHVSKREIGEGIG